ncbi:MAG: PPC domain-containing protein [Planctomycetia bacterium]|nr:PPC domain-containing protein [Planctomycetia bacterium]
MNRTLPCLIVLFVMLSTFSAKGQSSIGYVYPAGGQRGTTFRVLLGGRQIYNAQEVRVSGEGVSVKILRRYNKTQMNNSEEKIPAQRLYDEAQSLVLAEEAERPKLREEIAKIRQERLENPGTTDEEKAMLTDAQLAERFRFYDDLLEKGRPEDVQRVYYEYFSGRPGKGVPEIHPHMVLAEVTIAPDAPLGERQIVLKMPNFVTSPAVFLVGELPEVQELEPNDTVEMPRRWKKNQWEPLGTVTLPPAALPVVFNGQIYAGDSDRFSFKAQKGQKVILYVRGRYFTPYMADAVPGWFQPVITLYDANERELGNAGSYKFEPDPMWVFDVPADGTYTVAIQDSLFRGRGNFVYRLYVGAFPWVHTITPCCGEIGKPFTAKLDGWNLPTETLQIDKLEANDAQTVRNLDGILLRNISEIGGKTLIRPVAISLENTPVLPAKEKQEITFPSVFYGCLSNDEQVAEFTFQGKKGQRVGADVTAQALESTLDAGLELADASGKILAENDDRADCNGPNFGRRTHHSDPRIFYTLPADGTYTFRLYNTLARGARENLYRIRFSGSEPDFLLYCKQSKIPFYHSICAVEVGVLRYGGFDGAIELCCPDDEGITFQGGVIPPGRDGILCTVTCDSKHWPTAVPQEDGKPIFPSREIHLQGRVQIGDQSILRDVLPVEDWEQAFIYHHWMPTGPLTATFRTGFSPFFSRVDTNPVTLRPNETVVLEYAMEYANPGAPPEKLRRKSLGRNLDFRLSEKCAGLTLEKVEAEDGTYVKAYLKMTDPNQVPACGNILIEIRKDWQVRPKPDGTLPKLGEPFGYLPATPFVKK